MQTADRSDVELTRRIQVACAWCGPGFLLLLFGGWGFLGGFLPLIPPSDGPTQVAAAYAGHADLHRFGLVLAMVGVALTVPFFVVISLQLRRAERGAPVLALLQLASGLIVTVVLMVPILLFMGAAFRPERSPELTQLINDVSYVMLILPWPPVLGQLIPLSLAAFTDRGQRPVFPRWYGWYSLWVGLLLLPASLIVFFRTGAFAWTGLIGFWVPAAVFGAWYLVTTWLVLRSINAEAAGSVASDPT